jgi:endonuclease/exonuclease/phosphatase family metal-dependent hydrolase
MTRVLSYNILVGGTRRIDQIAQMIGSARPDVVGLVEASDPRVVKGLAKRLGMDYRVSGHGTHSLDWQIALLSRLPITHMQVHHRLGLLSNPLLEVGVQEEDGRALTLFVTHLTASFAHGTRGGDSMRREEAREILRIMRAKKGTPQLLMGDFW